MKFRKQLLKRATLSILIIIILTQIPILLTLSTTIKTQETLNDAPLESIITVTATTIKQTYQLRELLTLKGNITSDGTPVENALIAIEIRNPDGMPFIFRTLTIGTPTETWPITVIEKGVKDWSDNPITKAEINSKIRPYIKIKNNFLNPITVYITVTVFDENMIRLFAAYSIRHLDAKETAESSWSFQIPEWTKPGKALIFYNFYTNFPQNQGLPLIPEENTYIYIVRNIEQEPAYSHPTTTYNTSPGTYETYFKIPPDRYTRPGDYTVYISAKISVTERTFTKTSFNIQDVPSPPQAAFTYYPTKPYENQTITFDASSSSAEGFNDTIIRYEWDFGDGTPKVIKEGNYTNPPSPTTTHTYLNAGQYIVTLNVTDNEGLWSVTLKPITIYPEFGPTANFTYTPTAPIVNQTITFNASNSQPGWSKQLGDYSPITNYHWNFSDGTIIDTSDPIITHNYTQPGNYTVTLTITDSVGRTDMISTIIQVYNVTEKPWDVNNDGIVDIEDLYIVALHYGLTSTDPDWDPRCDINNDGIIDIEDVYTVALHYGEDP